MPTPEPPTQFRSFVAATLDAVLLEKIQAEQQSLARQLGSGQVRWTGAEQLHLTLKFFGNVATSDVEPLQLALQRSAAGIGPLRLSVQGLGCFPSRQKPSEIWCGLEGDLEPLERLQKQVDQECGRYGSHSEERPFHPHLTVGRVKAFGRELRQLGESLGQVSVGHLGEWTVSQITLMRSQLNPKGSVYTRLLEVPLSH
jgi:2'-5' RNA ligase